MKNKLVRGLFVFGAAGMMISGMPMVAAAEEVMPQAIYEEGDTLGETQYPVFGWYEENGKKYWYENGVRQGLEGRGKEIYDPASNAWYWLDSIYDGAMAADKEVYQESNGGKWVRYDENGHMIKGWYHKTNEDGTVSDYYYDLVTGAMQKGDIVIDGKICYFDEVTGVGLHLGFREINGKKYWYENGIRQGLEGRGKEIYDPASNAWYWLDSIYDGAMAADKEVYQDSNDGKWVRYDKNGHMIKGWYTLNNKEGKPEAYYYYDLITGAMIKGWFQEKLSDGTVNVYYFDKSTGRRTHGELVIDGEYCAFDTKSGIGLNQKWLTIGNKKYWYEGAKRQGMKESKEIFDPGAFLPGDPKDKPSGAWYYLSKEDGGAMVVDKVITITDKDKKTRTIRLDKNGQRVHGWYTLRKTDGTEATYYFFPTDGAMAKGKVILDGKEYEFDKETGVLLSSDEEVPMNYAWNPVKITYKKDDGSVDYYETKEYDDKNRVTREIVKEANGDLRSCVVYAYDNSGNMIRKTNYNSKSVAISSYEWTYDSAGNVTKEVFSDKVKPANSTTITMEYKDDKLSREYVFNNSKNLVNIWAYFYDGTSGKLIQKNKLNSKEQMLNWYVYKYDGKGNLLEEGYYGLDGENKKQIFRNTYKYDNNSNVIRFTEYGADDKEVQHTIYTYYTYAGQYYEKTVMTYKPDGSVVGGCAYERSGSNVLSYTKYGEKNVIEYVIKYDTSNFPTEKDKNTFTKVDKKYKNDKLIGSIETEYQLNKYEG